jgi:hypothetical protein
MLPVGDIGVGARPPIVTVLSGAVGEINAVRAVVTRASPRAVYQVRFRIGSGAGADSSCVASASTRVRAGTGPRLHIAVAPRGVWCQGTGVLSVAPVRHDTAAGTVRLRVRPARALGRGNLVGRLLLGPACPVERADDPCDPVPRPAPVTLVALDASGKEIARTVTLGDGSFALDLPAGRYTLHAAGGAAFPRITDTQVLVTARATPSEPQRVVVTGDTGIRCAGDEKCDRAPALPITGIADRATGWFAGNR